MNTETSDYCGPLTTEQLARLLSYHPESIRRAIRSGRIQALPFGRHYRISRAEVDRILREGLPAGDAR